MANEPVEFDGPEGYGSSLIVTLFNVNTPDTIAYTISSVAERTNDTGSYFFTVTGSAAGTYKLRARSPAGNVVKTLVILTNDTTLKFAGDLVNSSNIASAPTTAQIATAVWEDLMAGGDFGTAGSIGAFLAALAPPTSAAIVTAMFTDLMNSSDMATPGSFGALIKASIDAAISTRLATSGYTAPDNSDAAAAASSSASAVALITAVKAKTDNLVFRGVSPNTFVQSSLEAVAGDTAGIAGLNSAIKTIGNGTIGTGSTTTVLKIASSNPPITDINQFAGLVLKFRLDTTTVGLQGEGARIGSVQLPNQITLLDTLSEIPQSGDAFSFQ